MSFYSIMLVVTFTTTCTCSSIRPITFEGMQTEVIQRSRMQQEYRHFADQIRTLAKGFWKLSAQMEGQDPMGYTRGASYQVSLFCMAALSNIYNEIMNGNATWARRVLDAAGKPPANLMEPTLIWLGSYSECNDVVVPRSDHSSIDYQSTFTSVKYCKAIAPISRQVRTEGLFISSVWDFQYGLCVPNTCSPEDITAISNIGLEIVLNTTHLPYNFTQAICPTESQAMDSQAIIVIIILSLFALLMLAATFYDVTHVQNQQKTTDLPGFRESKKLETEKSQLVVNNLSVTSSETTGLAVRLLLSFSVYTNARKMLSGKQGEGALKCINGIRFLSLSWVVLGHTAFFGMSIGANTPSFSQLVFNTWSWQAISNATLSVDSFFALSGLLLTYLFLKEVEKKDGKVNWVMFYVHRYWRLTPVYMLVILVYIPTSKYWSSGPLWPQDGFDPGCGTGWWTNLLYVNNLVNPDTMCMAWSWYLANDMQFYILSPLLLIPLYKYPKAGVAAAIAALLGSLITTGVLSRSHYLGVLFFTVEGHKATGSDFDLIYIKPWCRAGPYIIGMLTGFILHKTECRKVLPWYAVILGWMTACICCLSTLYGMSDVKDTGITADVAALYNAVSRTVWSMGVCWLIYACVSGYGGFVNTLLSWSAFVPLSRLTYSAYLVHPILMTYYYYSRETLIYYQAFTVVYYFLGNLVLAMGTAFVVSLAFESPMMAIEKALLGIKKKQ